MKMLHPCFPCAGFVLPLVALALLAGRASAQSADLAILDCDADLCHGSSIPWTITKTANTSGVVNGSGTVVWTINAVKGTASSAGGLTVDGMMTLQNTGTAPAPIGNIVINLQKTNSQRIGGKLVPWVSVAADVADATSGDAATRAKILAAGSTESQPVNAAYGAINYVVNGEQGTFIETAGSGALTLTNAANNLPFSLVPQVSLAPGATITLLYRATFNNAILALAPGTLLRVEALISFGDAGSRGGGGAAAANIDINGNGVIDTSEGPAPGKVRTVACRTTVSLPTAGTTNDSVALTDMATDVVTTGAGIAFSNFATNIGGGTGTEVINASVTRTMSVNVSCSGTSSGSISNTAHLTSASSGCGAGLNLTAVSIVPISCTHPGTGGFQPGEFCTYTQDDWGTLNTAAAALLMNRFDSLYVLGGVELGINGEPGYSALFSSADAVLNYLPQGDLPGILEQDLLDPDSTSSGVFGGFLLALKLNVDFSAAGDLQGTGGPFGNLRLCHFSVQDSFGGPLTSAQADALNSLTVAQFVAQAEIAIGGGPVFAGFTIDQLASLAQDLSQAFQNCQPSAFAQAHLCRPTQSNWKEGDVVTYSQGSWGGNPTTSTAAGLLVANFLQVYPDSEVEVGLIAAAGFSMIFNSASAILNYQPASGANFRLNSDLVNPTTTSAGEFGGHVLALKLNVDFADAGKLGGASGQVVGNLLLYGLTATPQYNGMTVRQFLAAMSTAIGGGLPDPQDWDAFSTLTHDMNAAFEAGSPSQFAQDHLRTH